MLHSFTLMSSHLSNGTSFSFIERRRQKNAEKTVNFLIKKIRSEILTQAHWERETLFNERRGNNQKNNN